MIRPPSTLVILDGLHDALAPLIRAELPGLDVRRAGEAVTDPCAVITFSADAPLDRYPGLVWIHCAGAGVNGIYEALRATEAPPPDLMTRTVGKMGRQIGEYVLSYWLADVQRHAARRDLQSEQVWDVERGRPGLIEGRSALILGTGGIGAGVARVLGAMGARCIGASRSGRAVEGFAHVVRLDDLTDVSDVDLVIGALPLTQQTENRIDARVFDQLDGALFINVGRGATAELDAVKAALSQGRLRHTVLDVVPREPLPPESDLWDWPGVTITPHVSGLTRYEDTAAAFVAAYRALERGETPELVVDAEAGY